MPLVFFMPANELFDADYLQTVSREKDASHTLKTADGKDVQVFPGNLVELTDKEGKKQQGYTYKDADGNLLLRAQP